MKRKWCWFWESINVSFILNYSIFSNSIYSWYNYCLYILSIHSNHSNQIPYPLCWLCYKVIPYYLKTFNARIRFIIFWSCKIFYFALHLSRSQGHRMFALLVLINDKATAKAWYYDTKSWCLACSVRKEICFDCHFPSKLIVCDVIDKWRNRLNSSREHQDLLRSTGLLQWRLQGKHFEVNLPEGIVRDFYNGNAFDY